MHHNKKSVRVKIIIRSVKTVLSKVLNVCRKKVKTKEIGFDDTTPVSSVERITTEAFKARNK